MLNVSNYARKLSRFKRTISLIVFDGGRESYEEDTQFIYSEKKGTKEARQKLLDQFQKKQDTIRKLLSHLDDTDSPGLALDPETPPQGISFILHSTEPGKKSKEFNLINKMHYFACTNEFLRYLALAEYKPGLRTLKAFL